jgi:hypothetical protein
MEDGYLRIVFWGGATVLGVALLAAVVLLYRRHYRSGESGSPASVWSLEDLNAMRQRGDLSETEYAHLRDRALSAMGIDRRRSG